MDVYVASGQGDCTRGESPSVDGDERSTSLQRRYRHNAMPHRYRQFLAVFYFLVVLFGRASDSSLCGT